MVGAEAAGADLDFAAPVDGGGVVEEIFAEGGEGDGEVG